MSACRLPRTSMGLLGRLRLEPLDQSAWNTFVDRYAPPIYGWCRSWHLGREDAEDVTQEVLLQLAGKMRTFAYDPSGSFRGWLLTLVRHALSDFLKARQRQRPGGLVADQLDTLEARSSLEEQLAGAFDLELLDAAMARVKARVEWRTWQAFYRRHYQAAPTRQIAEDLQMPIAHVHVAVSRVTASIAAEAARMRQNGRTSWTLTAGS